MAEKLQEIAQVGYRDNYRPRRPVRQDPFSISKPFKTREQAEKAREKYPERLRKTVGLDVIKIKK
jgi:hypothetical protein